jgi:hypothetical protein
VTSSRTEMQEGRDAEHGLKPVLMLASPLPPPLLEEGQSDERRE